MHKGSSRSNVSIPILDRGRAGLTSILGRLVYGSIYLKDLLATVRDRKKAPLPEVYLIDGCHGGIPFWDWILLPQGGLWWRYFWPLVMRTLIRRARRLGVASVLEIDGYTFSRIQERRPKDLPELRTQIRQGKLEVVNGTYAQPFLQTISGEACFRQFYAGLDSIQKATGQRVVSYASQEPCFCAQLPQILKAFHYETILLRTHWAPFGSEPAFPNEMVEWQGPDQTCLPSIPRYPELDYSRLRDDPLHAGISNGGLAVTPCGSLERSELARFAENLHQAGVRRPVVSQLVDLFEAPAALGSLGALKPVTVVEYAQAARTEACPRVRLSQDDLRQDLPWGLQADGLIQARSRAEQALLRAERSDAQGWWQTGHSQEAILRQAWERLLLAQHHDLHVCGPWLSKQHRAPLADVGLALCAEVEQLAQQVLGISTQSPDKSYTNPLSSGSSLQLAMDGDGTLTVQCEGQVVLEGGGFVTVYRDERWYDSRCYIQQVEQVGENAWSAWGDMDGLGFRLWASVEQEAVRIAAGFDFGEGMRFGPQEPEPSYYLDDGKKLCMVFPVQPSTIVRDTPFYFEPTGLDHFHALSWVGVEQTAEAGLAILSRVPAGYYYDRQHQELRRVLAWAPQHWLYASDDSVTRNGSRYVSLSGRYQFELVLIPYTSRAQAARLAWEYCAGRLDWPTVEPDTLIVTGLFVHQNQLYLRAWNSQPAAVEAAFDFGEPVELGLVDGFLEPVEAAETRSLLFQPWQVRTWRVERCKSAD